MEPRSGITRRSGFVNYIWRSVRDANAAWHRFWFEPADPFLLGVLRLLTGWMLFYNLLVWSLDLEAFFGDDGLQPLTSVRRLHDSRLIFSFWVWIGDDYLWPLHFVCLTIAAMFCAGFMTRVTSLLSFLITISYSQRVPIANFGLDQILGILCLYLCLAPSGAECSLDAFLRRRKQRRLGQGSNATVKKSPWARMSMRLIQLHLCAIYFWSGHAKLKGQSWWTGDAMWRVLANEEYQTADLTWMAWVPWLPYLIAHVTIVWEVFFVVLIWNPRLRSLMLLAGVGMHIGIGAFLGMWTFGLIMIFAYLAFLDPDFWHRRMTLLTERISRTVRPAVHTQLSNASAGIGAETDTNTDASIDEIEPAAETTAALPERGTICIVSASSTERLALRRYLREHEFDCCAAANPVAARVCLSKDHISTVVINGTRLPSAALIDFATDVSGRTGVPIVLLLTLRQRSLLPEIERIAGATWIQLPASLHEIRLRLETLQRERSVENDRMPAAQSPETNSAS